MTRTTRRRRRRRRRVEVQGKRHPHTSFIIRLNSMRAAVRLTKRAVTGVWPEVMTCLKLSAEHLY